MRGGKREGAGRPAGSLRGQMGNCAFRCDQDIYGAAEAKAKASGTTIAKLLRKFIEEYAGVDRQGEQK